VSTYLDLETDRFYDDEGCAEHADWMTIKSSRGGGSVSISREYLCRDGSRRVDPEAGISFHTRHLDAVIDALVRLRADLPGLHKRSDT
jgi:hypothetical protein